jgi:hypothetical protein
VGAPLPRSAPGPAASPPHGAVRRRTEHGASRRRGLVDPDPDDLGGGSSEPLPTRFYDPTKTCPVLPARPAAPATSPSDRLRRADPLQGPGRYQTRSPTSSRSAQDRFQTLRATEQRCAETILRSRLDPGHPAGPAPGALRAGEKNTRQPAPNRPHTTEHHHAASRAPFHQPQKGKPPCPPRSPPKPT